VRKSRALERDAFVPRPSFSNPELSRLPWPPRSAADLEEDRSRDSSREPRAETGRRPGVGEKRRGLRWGARHGIRSGELKPECRLVASSACNLRRQVEARVHGPPATARRLAKIVTYTLPLPRWPVLHGEVCDLVGGSSPLLPGRALGEVERCPSPCHLRRRDGAGSRPAASCGKVA